MTPLGDAPMKLFIKSQFHTKSRPIPSSTSFAEQTVIVTGSNSGIGLATCKAMLDHNLIHLVMAVRTITKGEAAAAPLRKAYPKARIDIWALDMSSYNSIQSFVRRCTTELPRLDRAILNAGITQEAFKRCDGPDGHEEIFQVNYLSTALLAILLLPILKPGNNSSTRGPGRLTIVSSGLGLISKFPNRDAAPLIPSFDDPAGWGVAAASERYNTSKTLVLMLVQKLGEIISSEDVIINAVDPGMVGGSGLHSNVSVPVRAVMGIMKAIAARSLKEGASTYVDAVAVKQEESHGSFIMDWNTSA